MDLERTTSGFPETRWSLVAGASSKTPGEALAALIESYWPAVYSYLRRGGFAREEAGEITQAFFADVVLARDLFGSASRDKGRLRSLLITALKNYLKDAARRRAARSNGRPALPAEWLDREDAMLTDATTSPDDAFERRWAFSHLDEALRRAEAHFRRAGKGANWELFDARIVRPSVSNVSPPPLEDLARRHGFRTSADAAAACQHVRARIVEFLRDVVAASCPNSTDAEDEFRRCVSLLSNGT